MQKQYQMVSGKTYTKDGIDFFPTPEHMIHNILEKVSFTGTILEPTCGNGIICDVLKKKGYTDIIASDLYNHGYGVTEKNYKEYDQPVDNIFTNPPFTNELDFIQHFLPLYKNKLVVLAKDSFLFTKERYKELYTVNPPNIVYPVCSRPTFWRNNVKPKNGGTFNVAWLVWDRELTGSRIEWIL